MFPTVPNQLRSNAQRLGETREAIVEYEELGKGRRSVTFVELNQAAEQLAQILLRKQQLATLHNRNSKRHALVAGNTIECHVFYLACAIAGLTAVPINNSFTPAEIRQVLQSTKPCCLWYQPRYALNAQRSVASPPNTTSSSRRQIATLVLPTLQELLAQRDNDQVLASAEGDFVLEENTNKVLHRNWVILHTSGSTSGRKKGVIRNQFGTIGGIFLHQSALKLSEEDVYLAIWPSYGISTFFFTFGLLYLGAKVVLVDAALGADAGKSWQILHSEHVTFTTGSPLQFDNWVKLGADPSSPSPPPASLRSILISGSVVGEALSVDIRKRFPEHCQVLEAYGSTECGLISLRNHRDLSMRGVGVEPAGVPRVKICPSTQEIMVHTSSPMFMNGYVHFTHTNALTWFRTGDVGMRDELTGELLLLGRADSRISLPTGHDLYPEEVEVVLREVLPNHISLVVAYLRGALVGVLAVQDEYYSATIAAQQSEELVRRLHELAVERLSPMKRPSRYQFIRASDVPLTTTMKVKRKDLAKLLLQGGGNSKL